jgi:hypothetical protein
MRWCNSTLYGTPLWFNCYVFVCSVAISPNLVVSHSIKLIFTVGPAIVAGWEIYLVAQVAFGWPWILSLSWCRWRRIIISSGCDDGSMLDKLYQVRCHYAASIYTRFGLLPASFEWTHRGYWIRMMQRQIEQTWLVIYDFRLKKCSRDRLRTTC